MYVNCDRYIVIIIMIIIIILTFERINIIILMKIFKTFKKKFGDSDFINNGVNSKFKSNVNISFLKRSL